ncbi:MAG: hypothetical protein HY910_09325 [Desulfarculus sp.]|nr:hypothetical protein [Desulfarculus sp.]
MARLIWLMAALVLWAAAPAAALTPEEVIKLKKAGVSDATIEKMLEQERQGGSTQTGPVTETEDRVIYRSSQGTAEDIRRNEQHERWKEQKSMEMLKGGIIIDGRTGQPATAAPGGSTPAQGQGQQ